MIHLAGPVLEMVFPVRPALRGIICLSDRLPAPFALQIPLLPLELHSVGLVLKNHIPFQVLLLVSTVAKGISFRVT